MKNIGPIIQKLLPEIIKLRQHLHQNPELNYEEHNTAAQVLAHLKKIPNLDIRSGIGGTGIVATLGKEKKGPCVALRADMDALPMQEESDLPYKSKVAGKMHACGHDGHTSCLVGAALVLAQCTEDLSSPVKFIFQPAEENGAGGRTMCEEGALENPDVAAIFGLHGWPEMPQGQIGLCSGGFLAGTDDFEIDVHGTGGHAAFPHQGTDPILIASHIVTALQSIVSRNTDPLASAVVTVAQFHAGSADNVIPPVAKLRGTVRTLNENVRAHTLKHLMRLTTQIAEGFGGEADVRIDPGYPPLINDAQAIQTVRTIAQETLIADIKTVNIQPVMGGEDFAFYAQQIPAAFFALGLRAPHQDTYAHLHQPDFDFADDALPYGIKMHVEIARNFHRFWKPKK